MWPFALLALGLPAQAPSDIANSPSGSGVAPAAKEPPTSFNTFRGDAGTASRGGEWARRLQGSLTPGGAGGNPVCTQVQQPGWLEVPYARLKTIRPPSNRPRSSQPLHSDSSGELVLQREDERLRRVLLSRQEQPRPASCVQEGRQPLQARRAVAQLRAADHRPDHPDPGRRRRRRRRSHPAAADPQSQPATPSRWW